MKVIQTLGSLTMGGAEVAVERYLLRTDRTKFQPLVALRWYRRNSGIEDRLENAGIRVLYFGRKLYSLPFLPLHHVVQKFVRFPQICVNELIFQIQYCRLVLRERPDIIHMHLSVCYLPRFLWRFLQKKTGVRYCYTCHSTPETKFEKHKERRTAQYLVDRCGMELIALHEGMRRELSEMFHTDAVAVVHNGLELDRFRVGRMARDVRSARLGIPPDAWVIGHVGRFVPVKNHGFLLDVFARVLDRAPDAWLLLVGEHDLEADIRRRAEDPVFRGRVLIHPFTSDVPGLMSAMDAFVFPSLWEGFGNVMIEAQASGLPCLASDVVTTVCRVSTLCQFMSLDQPPEAWADALLSMRGQTPRELAAMQKFDITATTRRLEALYEEITGKHPGPAD